MKKARFTTEQIIAILQEHAAGAEPADLIRRRALGGGRGVLHRECLGDDQRQRGASPRARPPGATPPAGAGGRVAVPGGARGDPRQGTGVGLVERRFMSRHRNSWPS